MIYIFAPLIFIFLLFIIYKYYLYIHCKLNNKENDFIINDNCVYFIYLYGENKNKMNYEMSAEILKHFNFKYLLSEYVNVFSDMYKNEKVIAINIYESKKYGEMKLIKSYKLY